MLNVAITSAPVNPHTNLELIARSMGATAGYQTPSIPDADASLSALVQQDLNARLSVGTYGESKQMLTQSQVKQMLSNRLPELDDSSLDRLVVNLLDLAKRRDK